MTQDKLDPTQDDEVLRKRLLNRIAVAGVIIVGLLAGLAVFDTFNAPEPPAKSNKAAIPISAAEPGPSAEPAKTETAPAEEKSAVVEEQKTETAAAEPEQTTAPTLPARAEKPLTKPATARPVMLKPSSQAQVAVPPPHAVASNPTPAHAAVSPGPLARALDAARQFMLQVGVFSSTANAEELNAKLRQNGIPSQIESRVLVGPFRSKQEADDARQKLSALGVEPGIIVAGRK